MSDVMYKTVPSSPQAQLEVFTPVAIVLMHGYRYPQHEQAVAALAYGTESVPRVDKIVGPGNVWVATAKRLVFGDVAIDSEAGPSEVVVVADSSKFERRSLSVISKIDVVHRLITDSGVSPEAVAALRARNVEVIAV